MDRIVQSYMESFLALQQIEEKDQSRQFEMFASYCTVEQHYTDTYNLSDIITAEGGDCGIDAIAIIINGTMITSEEEVDDLIELNKKLSELYFVMRMPMISVMYLQKILPEESRSKAEAEPLCNQVFKCLKMQKIFQKMDQS